MVFFKKKPTPSENSSHKQFNLDTAKTTRLRKILRTAALSVALISWYTTANGLHQYVFGTLWHAYVISAALQGALFALSISGIELLLSLPTIPRRLGLGLAWACLLIASSIFSYVYISHDVYSDQLLQEDAHRVLREVCLSENYILSSKADELLRGTGYNTGILVSMDNYVTQLATLEGGMDLSSDGSNDKLTQLKNSLLPYAYTYQGASLTQSIDDCIDISNLIDALDKIMTGRFTVQDIEDTKETANNLIAAITTEKDDKDRQRSDKNNNLNNYQERLKTFTSTNSPEYRDLNQLVGTITDEIDALNSNISQLNNEHQIVKNVLTTLDSVSKGMSVSLYQDVQNLHSAINATEIDVQYIQTLADNIYRTLMENSAMLEKDDIRLTGYSGFKSDIERYTAVIDGQQRIQTEIGALYELESVKVLMSDATNEEAWENYWQERLIALKESAQDLQKGGLNAETITSLIHELEQKERLYLSDLNDFERAWGLLFGPHPYKSLLIFSAIFSFGIDLFSVLMSTLLYLFKPKRDVVNIAS